MQFKCNQCGQCCRHIDKIEELKDFDLGNGVCKMLNGNLCSIYVDRPIVCNVEKMYELKYKYVYDLNEYYKMNLYACEVIKKNKLKEE